MPRGDKSKYTEKEKRQAEHIEEGYENRGVPEDEAERRAWATVNKVHGAGKNPAVADTASRRITSQCEKADENRTMADHARPKNTEGHPLDALFVTSL